MPPISRRWSAHRARRTQESSTTWLGSARLRSERGWWFHVDGAYGGSGIFARSLRPKYAGLEQADSFILDPHKWLFTPFDCCALLYRDPEFARATHTQDASYLDVIHTSDGEWNPTDYAYHLTRRARGLPLWFSLAVNGIEAYRDAIEVAVALAKRDGGADQRGAAAGADPRARPRRGVVPQDRLEARGLRRVGAAPARGAGRVHPADEVGGRNRWAVRVPAPTHPAGAGARGARRGASDR